MDVLDLLRKDRFNLADVASILWCGIAIGEGRYLLAATIALVGVVLYKAKGDLCVN